MPSAAYLDALDTHNAAVAAFDTAREAYRAKTIGDDEYLAARAVFATATAIYDAAYAAEEERDANAE